MLADDPMRRLKLVKIGAKTVCRGWYAVFQLAEVAVPRAFRRDPCRIDGLRLRSPPLPT
jgi:hypothetical protein